MSLPSFARPALLACAALLPMTAFAHPGHDGGHDGGLTWDFVGEVLHRLTSPYHLAPLLAAAVALLLVMRLAKSRNARRAPRSVLGDGR